MDEVSTSGILVAVANVAESLHSSQGDLHQWNEPIHRFQSDDRLGPLQCPRC